MIHLLEARPILDMIWGTSIWRLRITSPRLDVNSHRNGDPFWKMTCAYSDAHFSTVSVSVTPQYNHRCILYNKQGPHRISNPSLAPRGVGVPKVRNYPCTRLGYRLRRTHRNWACTTELTTKPCQTCAGVVPVAVALLLWTTPKSKLMHPVGVFLKVKNLPV